MAELAPEWATYRWFHSIDLGDGRVTKGGKSLTQIREEEQLLFDGIDLNGATVIDIGAWNGAFTFAAARRGSLRVLATDSYTWAHPYFRGKEGFDFAHAALKLNNIETKFIDLRDISPRNVGQFDVCVFAGLLYHLPSPTEGLEKAASVARECLVIETQTDLNDIEKPALVYYAGASLNGDDTNYFGPNIPFLIEALRELDFSQFDVNFSGENRVVVHAWRSTARRKFTGGNAINFHSKVPASRYQELQAKVAKIEASRSWKLTAPFRRLSNLLGLSRR